MEICPRALLAEACFVREEDCNVLGLLTDVRALILTIFIDIPEFLENFNGVDAISKVGNNVF